MSPLDPLEICATAQHHGIPTRLLDWTRRPLVAAFMAAEDAIRKGFDRVAGKALSVWAFNYGADQRAMKQGRVKRVFPYRGSNAFLRAQDGVFLWESEVECLHVTFGAWPSIDEAIEKDARLAGCLQKLIMPASESPALLKLLRIEGITRAHLMPSLDNVASTAFPRDRQPAP